MGQLFQKKVNVMDICMLSGLFALGTKLNVKLSENTDLQSTWHFSGAHNPFVELTPDLITNQTSHIMLISCV